MKKGFNCTIYASSDTGIEEFRKEISVVLNLSITSISFITGDKYELSVRKNDEFNKNTQTEFPDGFLYFKYIMDIQFYEVNNVEFCIQEISKILVWLWGKNIPAVASYDYEDALPEKGGYKSVNIPWVK